MEGKSSLLNPPLPQPCCIHPCPGEHNPRLQPPPHLQGFGPWAESAGSRSGAGAGLSQALEGSPACTQGLAALQAAAQQGWGGGKWASHQGEVLRKHGWLQARRSCRHRGPVNTVPAQESPRQPSPTYLVLAIGTQKVSLSEPGDDGLGVPKRHAGQGDAAALLRLYVLRRGLRERGGSWGHRTAP